MSISTVRETKATLRAEAGRVLVWHNDKEQRSISLAVPGDRAKLSPAQARELGVWLMEASEQVSAPTGAPFQPATTRRAYQRPTW